MICTKLKRIYNKVTNFIAKFIYRNKTTLLQRQSKTFNNAKKTEASLKYAKIDKRYCFTKKRGKQNKC